MSFVLLIVAVNTVGAIVATATTIFMQRVHVSSQTLATLVTVLVAVASAAGNSLTRYHETSMSLGVWHAYIHVDTPPP